MVIILDFTFATAILLLIANNSILFRENSKVDFSFLESKIWTEEISNFNNNEPKTFPKKQGYL